MTTRSTKFTLEVLRRNQAKRLTPLELPAVLSQWLIANWGEPIQVTSEYTTDVSTAVTTNEERLQLADRPLRTQSVRLTGLNAARSAEILMSVMRLGTERQVWPLYSDHSRVTATSAGAGDQLYLDTRYRRFFLNGLIMVHDWSAAAGIQNVEIHQIREIYDDHIRTYDPLTLTFNAGDRVYPLLDAELQLENSHQLVVPAYATATVEVTEVSGGSALPATVPRGDDGFSDTYSGLAIFSPRADWTRGASVSVIRSGTAGSVGRARVIEVSGDRPRLEFTQDFAFLSRADWWDLHRFLDARRGRAYPFWYVAPHRLFEPVSMTSVDITVKALKNIEDVEAFIQYLGFRLYDGTQAIRGVDGVTDNLDGTWTIDFDSSLLGVTIDDVRTLTSAHLVRLASDAVTESWTTDEVVEMRVTFRELPRDEAASLTSFTPPPPTARSTKVVIEVLAES